MVGGGQRDHPRLEPLQIFRAQDARQGEITEETIADGSGGHQLDLGMQLLERHAQQQRAGAPQNLQALRFAGGNEADAGVLADHERAVHQQAVHPPGDRCLDQPRANARGQLRYRKCLVVLAHGTVGQCDVRHAQ